MLAENKNLKIIFVVGPTASGKSQLALTLAKKFKGCIVNIDSIQCYEGLDIGSAAPTTLEKNEVPHFLFSYVKAPQESTAGQYIRDFYKLLETTVLPSPVFIVGGTGFYIQALEKGMYAVPEITAELKNQIIRELEVEGIEKLYAELLEFDPQTLIHTNDHYRICRALEVKRAFGKKMSDLKNIDIDNKNQLPFDYIKIGLTFDTEQKQQVIERVEKRTEGMISQGFIDEVQRIIDQGFVDWAPLQSVGYYEISQYLNNEIKSADLQSMIVQSTVKLIKKQKTWFKRDPQILWQNMFAINYVNVEQTISKFCSDDNTHSD